MQLFTRVLLLAVTVLGASAWPRMADEPSLFRMMMGQLSSSMVESRALSAAEAACVNSYNNATNKIGEQLANSTGNCEEVANRTQVANSVSSNATITEIRNLQLTIEKNLQQCKNETDSQRYINCTLSTFDQNLQLLDKSNSLAYQTQSQFTSNSTLVQSQRSSCISAAVGESKVKSIEAANDFDSCMAKVPNQRELPAQQQVQPKEQPQQVQPQKEQTQEQQPLEQQVAQPAQPVQPVQPEQPVPAQQPGN